jgi:endonuclease/exonuclease/phosphatase family metal-dependent hydrolase
VPTFTLATFNVENLFARYKFRSNVDAYEIEGFTVNELAFDIYDEAEKKITAEAIREVDADIVCLQEVESLTVLDRLKSRYLPKAGYDHRILVDCFDPRHIDVGVLSRHPITRIRTYRHERVPGGSTPLFSRDCLEVDFNIKGKEFTVYVNHFKSMMGGRAQTKARRRMQAEKTLEIVKARFPDLRGNFAIVGDLNDYPDAGTALGGLLDSFTNIIDFLPEEDRWTHHWASGPAAEQYNQLDYIFLPSNLVDAAKKKPKPVITRKGLPWRAARYPGERFDDVGENDPKASDHCPVSVELTL